MTIPTRRASHRRLRKPTNLATGRQLAAYPEGAAADIAAPGHPLTANLDGAVTRFPDRVALDFLGAATTYAQLGDRVARAAEALRGIGCAAATGWR